VLELRAASNVLKQLGVLLLGSGISLLGLPYLGGMYCDEESILTTGGSQELSQFIGEVKRNPTRGNLIGDALAVSHAQIRREQGQDFHFVQRLQWALWLLGKARTGTKQDEYSCSNPHTSPHMSAIRFLK
jgi:hypothetical protein